MTAPSARLVFICAHNACRSAIAEVIAADVAAKRGLSVRVTSAGTHALSGYEAASIAQATISEIGLSLERHRSRLANEDIIAKATLVVTMTDEQKDLLHNAFPKYQDKVVSFNDITHCGDVPDPVGGNVDEVRSVRILLQASMPAIFETLISQSGGRL